MVPEGMLDLSAVKAIAEHQEEGFSTQIICEEITLEQPSRKDSSDQRGWESDPADEPAAKMEDVELELKGLEAPGEE